MLISNQDVVLRLVTIMVLSGVIGMEREYHAKPAGLRTNVMVGLGSTLMTIASISVLDVFPNLVGVDPLRLAAQVITGIGFIGAGAILRQTNHGSNVIGLTTAATLWVVCGLGIAVGMGLFFEAIVTTFLVLFTFTILGRIVDFVRKHSSSFEKPADYHPPTEN